MSRRPKLPTPPAPSIYQTLWVTLAEMLTALFHDLCNTFFPGVGLIEGFIFKVLLMQIYQAQNHGNRLTTSALARAVGMHPDTCTGKLKALVEMGFIERRGRAYVVVAWMPEADQRRALNRITATLTQAYNQLVLARRPK
jgi:MarR family